METNLFPLKYRLRKTGELVEVIAWETADKGTRSERDWVSYIDASGVEHYKDPMTLEWDFVIDSPFESLMSQWEPTKLAEFDPWEARRYELVKEMFFRTKDFDVAFLGYDGLVKRADAIIEALKMSPEA